MRRALVCLALTACTAAAHRDPNTEAADAATVEETPAIDADAALDQPDAHVPPPVNDAAPPTVDAWQPPPQDADTQPDTSAPPPVAVDAGPYTVCQIISLLTHPDVPCPTTGQLVWFNQTTGSVGQCTDAGWTNVDGQRQNCPAGEYCQYRDLDGGVYTGVCHL